MPPAQRRWHHGTDCHNQVKEHPMYYNPLIEAEQKRLAASNKILENVQKKYKTYPPEVQRSIAARTMEQRRI
jgi:hypothetical protein